MYRQPLSLEDDPFNRGGFPVEDPNLLDRSESRCKECFLHLRTHPCITLKAH